MRYRLTAEVTIEVDVADQNAIDRCVNNEDNWRGVYYDLRTADEVFHHWAWNACANGRRSVEKLDGWADLTRDAVRMDVTDVSYVDVELVEP